MKNFYVTYIKQFEVAVLRIIIMYLILILANSNQMEIIIEYFTMLLFLYIFMVIGYILMLISSKIDERVKK